MRRSGVISASLLAGLKVSNFLGAMAGFQARNRRSMVMETLAPTEGLTLADDLRVILTIECIRPFNRLNPY